MHQLKWNGAVKKGKPAGATGGLGPDGRKINARDWRGVSVSNLVGVEPGHWPYWRFRCSLCGDERLYDSQNLRKKKDSGGVAKCKGCGK